LPIKAKRDIRRYCFNGYNVGTPVGYPAAIIQNHDDVKIRVSPSLDDESPKMSTLLALTMIVCLDGPDTVDARVVAYARSKLGQRVGDGECTALAGEALRRAGAKLPGPGDRSWGMERKSLADSRPGDILQFEGAVFVHQRIRDDGAVITLNASYPHHTAIVSGVKKRGKNPVLVILHQNAGVEGGNDDDRKVVQEWTIDLAEKKKGSIKAYQPVAEP
jgi:hypothetical protein